MKTDYIKITPDNAPLLIGRKVFIDDSGDRGLHGVITGWEKTPYYTRVIVDTENGIRKYMVALYQNSDSHGMHLMNEAVDAL